MRKDVKGMNKIKEYRKRRYTRLMARADAADDDKGSWITTENGHKVHLNEEGQPDKGNPHVLETMNGQASGGGNSGSSSNGESVKNTQDYIKHAKDSIKKGGGIPSEIKNTLRDKLKQLPTGTKITVGRGDVFVKNERGGFDNQFGESYLASEMSMKCLSLIRDFGSDIIVSEGDNRKPSQNKPNGKNNASIKRAMSSGQDVRNIAKAFIPNSRTDPDAESALVALNFNEKSRYENLSDRSIEILNKALDKATGLNEEITSKQKIDDIDREIDKLNKQIRKAQHYGNNESGDWDTSDELERKVKELEDQKRKLSGK